MRMDRDRGDRGDRSFANNDCKVYVGNLPGDIRSRDLEDIFYKYGKIVDVDLHDRRGPPFAFVEFEDARDADDAVRGRDGYSFDGYRIRVEFPRASTRGTGSGSSGYRRQFGGFGRPNNKPKGYQLLVSGLPPTGSWQDLKDHFRPAGDVVYTDSYNDGTGIVEFSRYEDFKRALRDMDDSKFRSHEGETAYIRVKDPKGSRSPSPYQRSRSHSRSRSRSRSY